MISGNDSLLAKPDEDPFWYAIYEDIMGDDVPIVQPLEDEIMLQNTPPRFMRHESNWPGIMRRFFEAYDREVKKRWEVLKGQDGEA